MKTSGIIGSFVLIAAGLVLSPDGALAQRHFDGGGEPPRLRTTLPQGVLPRQHSHHFGQRPFLGAPFVPGVVVVPPLAYAPAYVPPVVYDAPGYVPAPPAYPPVSSAPGGTISVAPPPPEIVEFPEGRYELRGDGITTPYRWVWIPRAPSAPPSSTSSAGPSVVKPEPGQKTFYRWTAPDGSVHWTDRLESVPQPSRGTVMKSQS